MKVIPVAIFMLMLQPLSAQYNWGALEAAFTSKQKLLGNNVVALIWKNDALIYKKEMGDFNMKTQAPIASSSKWLTAALVMQQVDEGKIALDDKASKYIPELDKYFKGYITIRQCLSHMTGIEDEGKLIKKLFQRRKLSSLEEEIHSFAERDIRAKPGTDFWYGNIGLNIAGRVLEVVSKKKFDLLMKIKLLNPLGMRKTTFTNLDGNIVNPSGGAQSTAEDYMKFLAMLLNNGKYNGVQILSEASVNELRKIQTKQEQVAYAPKSAEGFNYALGSWVLEEDLLPTSSKGGREMATVLACPGLFGTWPMIDYCRGYAYLFFVKNLLGDERAEAQVEIKKIIDAQMAGGCN